MAILMVLMLIIYNMYFDNDTNEQTKIVIMDINENTQHVISQGGDENAIIRYNNFVSNLLSERGFIVLDRASILGPVPTEYLAPLFDLSVITPTSSTYEPRRQITTLTQNLWMLLGISENWCLIHSSIIIWIQEITYTNKLEGPILSA